MKKRDLPKVPGALLMHDSGTLAFLWDTGTWLILDRLGVFELTRTQFKLDGLQGWWPAVHKKKGGSVCTSWPQEMTPSQ